MAASLPVPDPVRLVPGRVARRPRARRGHAAVEYWNRDLVLWRDEPARSTCRTRSARTSAPTSRTAARSRAATLSARSTAGRYDGDGACTNIPYSERTNRKAQLRTYPVVERNGFVLAWYHPDEDAPKWDVPVIDEIGDPAWSEFYRRRT